MTISEIAYLNIKYLCSRKGVPLANIERQIHRSAGWLSRAQSKNAIRLSDVEIAANMLDTPFAALLDRNLMKTERIEEIKAKIRAAEAELREAERS